MEERHGGHTIANHVGKSPQALIDRMLRTRYRVGNEIKYMFRNGSFPSVEAAKKLVNATLARNREIVERVARGEEPDAFVRATFPSKTGIEFYRENDRQQPVLRDAYGVGVRIVHDPATVNGYYVRSAFPLND